MAIGYNPYLRTRINMNAGRGLGRAMGLPYYSHPIGGAGRGRNTPQWGDMFQSISDYYDRAGGFYDRAGDIFDEGLDSIGDFKDFIGDFGRRDRRRQKDFRQGFEEYRDFIRGQSEEDKAYWQNMRDDALKSMQKGVGAWEKARGESKDQYIAGLRQWDDVLQEEGGFLRGLRDQQMGLAQELRDAPSTVEEQARINADKQLQQATAMAGALGGGLSTNLGALGAQADTQLGDVLRDTSALRAQEYQSRIGQQAGLLGQAGATSGALAGLGATNLGAQTGYADFLKGLGTTDFNVYNTQGNFLSNLGARNFDIGSGLINREGNIFTGLGQTLGFGRAGDLAEGGFRSSIPGMYGSLGGGMGALGSGMAGIGSGLAGLGAQQYGIFSGERAWEQGMRDRNLNMWSGILGGMAKVGVPLLGAGLGFLAGGPPGAVAGLGMGSGLMNLGNVSSGTSGGSQFPSTAGEAYPDYFNKMFRP